MDKREVGPDPDDIEAWRQVIESQSLPSIRSQSLVATVQRCGPSGERRVVELLMKEISARIMRILRKQIGRNHRNEGWDLIEDAHSQLIEAVLKHNSADGTALRTAFHATVLFRGADAIRREQLHSSRYDYAIDKGALPLEHKKTLSDDEEHAHVESVLRQINNPKRRLAFRLYMDGVPRNSTKVESIASALGVSAKTAETWIKETKEEIRSILGEKP